MTTPDVTDAVARALAVSAEWQPRIVPYETARIAIDAVRKADAEAGAVTLMPGEVPPWMDPIGKVAQFVHHEPGTGKYGTDFCETYANPQPLRECSWACCRNTHEGEEK